MESPHPSDYADALTQVLDALELGRVILVGHSLGSLFAGSFAATRPSRVAALALLSPALGYRVAAGAALPPNVQSRIDDIERLGPEAFAASRAAKLVYSPETKPEVLARVRSAMAALNKTGYAQAVRALGHGDLLADAARITAPTSVAIGAEDAVTPPAGARALHAALANPLEHYRLLLAEFQAELGKDADLPATAAAIQNAKNKKEAPPVETAIPELEDAIAGQIGVSDLELQALGKRRTRAIQDVLLAEGGIDASRVFIINAPAKTDDSGKVRVEMALK